MIALTANLLETLTYVRTSIVVKLNADRKIREKISICRVFDKYFIDT